MQEDMLMKKYENEVFEGLDTYGRWSRKIENMEFCKCHFQSSFTISKRPKHRFLIRNVKLVRCTYLSCDFYSTILEDIIVDGLHQRGRSPLFFWGCGFRHVCLQGKLSTPILNAIHSISPTEKQKKIWEKVHADYYKDVDWALDIREAKFTSFFDVRGVPADLVRRDPESQIVVRRGNVLSIGNKLENIDSLWPMTIKWFLESGASDIVIVAGKGNPKFKQWKEEICYMKDIGVAE